MTVLVGNEGEKLFQVYQNVLFCPRWSNFTH